MSSIEGEKFQEDDDGWGAGTIPRGWKHGSMVETSRRRETFLGMSIPENRLPMRVRKMRDALP